MKETSRPNISDESQFHQPPHVPSWRAHQLPIQRAVKFTVSSAHVGLKAKRSNEEIQLSFGSEICAL